MEALPVQFVQVPSSAAVVYCRSATALEAFSVAEDLKGSYLVVFSTD